MMLGPVLTVADRHILAKELRMAKQYADQNLPRAFERPDNLAMLQTLKNSKLTILCISENLFASIKKLTELLKKYIPTVTVIEYTVVFTNKKHCAYFNSILPPLLFELRRFGLTVICNSLDTDIDVFPTVYDIIYFENPVTAQWDVYGYNEEKSTTYFGHKHKQLRQTYAKLAGMVSPHTLIILLSNYWLEFEDNQALLAHITDSAHLTKWTQHFGFNSSPFSLIGFSQPGSYPISEMAIRKKAQGIKTADQLNLGCMIVSAAMLAVSIGKVATSPESLPLQQQPVPMIAAGAGLANVYGFNRYLPQYGAKGTQWQIGIILVQLLMIAWLITRF